MDVDIVLSQESGAIAYLNCAQPVVVWTDASYGAIIGAYDFVTGLCGKTRRALERMGTSEEIVNDPGQSEGP